MSDKLPINWEWISLGEYVENHDAARVPVSSKEREKLKGKYPYYGASGVIDQIDGYTHQGEYLLLGEDGANLLARSKPIAFLAKGKFWVNNHAHVLKCRGEAPNAYLAYYLNRIDLAPYVTGTAQPKLSQAKMNKIPIPVAPLDQQKCIVAEIEKQFSRLDEAVANLKRIKANLKRYKAAVLKAAVEGKLTAITSMLSPTPFGELIEGLSQGWSPKCDLTRDPLPNEWAIIKTTAVQSMRYFDSESKPLPSKLAPRSNIEIKAGDFLMTRKGPRQRAGVACLVRKTRSRLMVCDTVYRFRCIESRVSPAYLELALNSPLIVSEIDRRKSGISDSGVSLTHDKLGSVLVPTPQLAEQEPIVAEVERRLSVIDELEAAVEANLTRADRLRQSILSQAFSGELHS